MIKKKRFIEVKWVPETQFGYDKAMRIIKSDHKRFIVGSRFDFGFLDIAVEEGYSVLINPVEYSEGDTEEQLHLLRQELRKLKVKMKKDERFWAGKLAVRERHW